MRVFLYCRVAHDDRFNLEAQAATLQRYARKAGYTIVGASSEQGSGMTLDRPALKKVTEAVLAGKVDMVLVKDLSRIGREWGMTHDYINLLIKNKVKLLCIKDQIVFDNENAECPLWILKSYKDTPHGTSIHNDSPANPHESRLLGNWQTHFTILNTFEGGAGAITSAFFMPIT